MLLRELFLREAAAPADDHIDDAPAPAVNAAPAAAAPAGDNSRAQDILAMIRNRQKQ